jgi:hypothetical protein
MPWKILTTNLTSNEDKGWEGSCEPRLGDARRRPEPSPCSVRWQGERLIAGDSSNADTNKEQVGLGLKSEWQRGGWKRWRLAAVPHVGHGKSAIWTNLATISFFDAHDHKLSMEHGSLRQSEGVYESFGLLCSVPESDLIRAVEDKTNEIANAIDIMTMIHTFSSRFVFEDGPFFAP